MAGSTKVGCTKMGCTKVVAPPAGSSPRDLWYTRRERKYRCEGDRPSV